jgi:hypothetical protein
VPGVREAMVEVALVDRVAVDIVWFLMVSS